MLHFMGGCEREPEPSTAGNEKSKCDPGEPARKVDARICPEARTSPCPSFSSFYLSCRLVACANWTWSQWHSAGTCVCCQVVHKDLKAFPSSLLIHSLQNVRQVRSLLLRHCITSIKPQRTVLQPAFQADFLLSRTSASCTSS